VALAIIEIITEERKKETTICGHQFIYSLLGFFQTIIKITLRTVN